MLSNRNSAGFLDKVYAAKSRFISTINNYEAISAQENAPQLVANNEQVKVHVRVRPLNKTELGHADSFKTVYSRDKTTSLYFPSFQVLTDPAIDVHTFPFDFNHQPECDQDSIYATTCTKQVPEMIKAGGIFCLIAYGQTGSGKTYNVSSICDRLANDLPFKTHDISIQMLEVMGDVVKDLLSGSEVRILVNPAGRPVIQGDTEERSVKSTAEARETIEKGFSVRKTAGTFKNATSSRSHFVCLINLVSKASKVVSQIKLVDLAGSERNSDSKNHDPERIKESAYINASLMALKNCIRQRNASGVLSPSTSSTSLTSAKDLGMDRVPYRSSKLTILLKDVLVSSPKLETRLVMIATLSPTINDVSHSLDTFRYAAALKGSTVSSSSGASTPVPAVTATTPMSWTETRLANWFAAQTSSQLSLQDLIQSDLVRKDPGEFVLPVWKHVYELPQDLWISRSKGKLIGGEEGSAPAATDLRLKYRGLFIRQRPSTKATEVCASYPITTILLDEPSLQHVRPKSAKSRQEIAMDKIKQRGKLALGGGGSGSVGSVMSTANGNSKKPTATRKFVF